MYWSLGDKDYSHAAYTYFDFYMEPTGLWQNWNVFAPPPTTEPHIVIEGISKNFNVSYTPRYQTIPRMISYERERKWHENIIKNDFTSFRAAYLRYWCREMENQYQRNFDEVVMKLYTREIPNIDIKERKNSWLEDEWVMQC